MDNFVLSFVVYTFSHRSTTCCRGIERQMPRANSGRVWSSWRRNDGERQRFALARTTLRFTNVVYQSNLQRPIRSVESWRVGETGCVECAAWTQVARMQLVCERFWMLEYPLSSNLLALFSGSFYGTAGPDKKGKRSKRTDATSLETTGRKRDQV